mmetsp:Transcript_1205/g.1398  ORF Transcript_1205/g.1398 Transcript_1205/m.1398 type:complete len:95 (+) Transcript_1205:97-381(+)
MKNYISPTDFNLKNANRPRKKNICRTKRQKPTWISYSLPNVSLKLCGGIKFDRCIFSNKTSEGLSPYFRFTNSRFDLAKFHFPVRYAWNPALNF